MGMMKRERGHNTVLIAVRDAAIVFAPSHFRRIAAQIAACDAVMLARLRAA
jgi:hypothetical protein